MRNRRSFLKLISGVFVIIIGVLVVKTLVDRRRQPVETQITLVADNVQKVHVLREWLADGDSGLTVEKDEDIEKLIALWNQSRIMTGRSSTPFDTSQLLLGGEYIFKVWDKDGALTRYALMGDEMIRLMDDERSAHIDFVKAANDGVLPSQGLGFIENKDAYHKLLDLIHELGGWEHLG